MNEWCIFFTLKKLRVNLISPPVVFPKMRFSEVGWRSAVFVKFKIITRHIFSEKLIEILQVFQKIWRFSSSILTIFIIFLFFDIFVLQRNWWRQHITNDIFIFSLQPTLNSFFNNYINLHWYWISSSWNMKREKNTFKQPSLIYG